MKINSSEFYYKIKPLIPRYIQVLIRRFIVNKKINSFKNNWPIDRAAGDTPDNWIGWPDGKKFALVLTHDVETKFGHDKCEELLNIDKNLGFVSSFNFVPERYKVSKELRDYLVEQGFEVGLHDLKHDGKLFKSRKVFLQNAIKINKYIEEWNSVGFRAGAMLHDLELFHALNIEYDASTFDTDPFEPQPDGVGTIFPFWVEAQIKGKGYIELPYTLPQDFTLFILMRHNNIDIWKKKLDWIVEKGGLALLITHPDYMSFNGEACGYDKYPSDYYIMLLDYIKKEYANEYINVLPKILSSYCKKQYIGT